MAQKTEKSMEKGTESKAGKIKEKAKVFGKYGCVGSSGTVYIDVFRRCFPTASAADQPL